LTQVKLFLENLEVIPRVSGKTGISFVRNSKEGLVAPEPFTLVSPGSGNTDVARI
jgi:hypothetical protein